MNQLGATDPDTMAMIGQEEYEVAAEQIQSQQNLKRLSKMVRRMAAVIGLESGFPDAVAIEIKETCLPGQGCTGQASGMETGQASAHDDVNVFANSLVFEDKWGHPHEAGDARARVRQDKTRS